MLKGNEDQKPGGIALNPKQSGGYSKAEAPVVQAEKNKAAQELGRMRGKARAAALSKKKRVAIARVAANKRWGL